MGELEMYTKNNTTPLLFFFCTKQWKFAFIIPSSYSWFRNLHLHFDMRAHLCTQSVRGEEMGTLSTDRICHLLSGPQALKQSRLSLCVLFTHSLSLCALSHTLPSVLVLKHPQCTIILVAVAECLC